MNARNKLLAVGRVSGLHGVSGWIKVYSHTDPPENIFQYQPWILEYANSQHEVSVVDSRRNGKILLAKLSDMRDRDQAAQIVDADILVARDLMPAPVEGQYYWADLVGIKVIDENGFEFGEITRLFETGANDVMVVKGERERMIPWLLDEVITDVDMVARQIKVRWDPEF